MEDLMVRRLVQGFAIVAALLAAPLSGFAQEASILGVITDDTGGVMPGVTVTITHDASGNAVTTVTNERGEYGAPVRTGPIHIVAELGGFATINRAMELLVGQRAVVNLQMKPAALEESVTVTGATPLLDVTQSKIGGNIDRRQMQELPVNGRNFLDLTMLAPGSRANAVADTPGVAFGQFQLNVDGQQITQNCCSGAGGQPKFSKDSIEEFQFISNRFDATQGRSAGVQVNVVSKSGTNNPNGTFAGYFRDDSLAAADFIAKKVIPYQDQQLSGTYGGPIVKDKVHYFGNYEFEREPGSFIYQNASFPKFDAILTRVRKEQKINGRMDFQLTGKTHLMVRASKWQNNLPIDTNFAPPGQSVNVSQATKSDRYSDGLAATFTTVVSSRALNILKLDHAGQYWQSTSILPNWTNANNPNTFAGPRDLQNWLPNGSGTPLIAFSGYNIGTLANIPQRIGQETYDIKDDFSYILNAKGRHSLKTGFDYMNYKVWHKWCNVLNGRLNVQRAAPANVADFFPDPLNPATWNVTSSALGLSTASTFDAMVGSCRFESPRDIFGTWVQDDWEVSPKLTLNIGGRYDWEYGTWANEVAIEPFLKANRPDDFNNYVPRLGAAYRLTDKTVLRGGWGKYFSETINQTAHNTHVDDLQTVISIPYDGRQDFAINPWNGPIPTYQQIQARFCSTLNASLATIQATVSNTQALAGNGCIRRGFGSSMVSPYAQVPYSYQGTMGFQQQLTDTMGFDVDYVWTGTRHDRTTNTQTNLNYNPATGFNYPSTDLARIPYPQFGIVGIDNMNGYSNYKALQVGFNKRFSHNYQFSATYALSDLKDSNPRAQVGADEVPADIVLKQDLAGEYGPAVGDQRHRATVNGIWALKYGFQLSGLYFYGAGQRFATVWGADVRNIGTTNASGRQRTDGSIVPRNNFTGKPIHRVDVRVLRSFKLTNKAKIDGTFEVFNLFNHANYGSYFLQERTPATYGQPQQVANTAYQPRMAQIGFRLQF